MKDWNFKQSDFFYKKEIDIRKIKPQYDITDKWVELSNDLANKLATSPKWYSRVITCEWCFLIGLSSWLVLIFATILH
jgi:hypothetical protein